MGNQKHMQTTNKQPLQCKNKWADVTIYGQKIPPPSPKQKSFPCPTPQNLRATGAFTYAFIIIKLHFFLERQYQ